MPRPPRSIPRCPTTSRPKHCRRRCAASTDHPRRQVKAEMSTRTVLRWNLRQLMAQNGMFATTDLVAPLHERGVEISRQMVHRIATKPRSASISTCSPPSATSCRARPTTCSSSSPNKSVRRPRSTTADPASATCDPSAPPSAAPTTTSDSAGLLGVCKHHPANPTDARASHLCRMPSQTALSPREMPAV